MADIHPCLQLPKWQPMFPEIPTHHHKLCLGFTPPTIAIVALSIFLFLILETNRKMAPLQAAGAPDHDDTIHRRSVSAAKIRRSGSKLRVLLKWPLLTKLLTCHCSFPSRVLYRALDFERELSSM